MCKNAIGSTQAVNRGALLLYKARKGRKDRRKERLSLSLSLSASLGSRDCWRECRTGATGLVMARFGGVLRPVPESTCASLRACLWLGSASAMPCPAQRSSALLLAPGQSQHLLPLSLFSLFLPLRQPHPHGIPPWVSQSSSPRIARRKRKKRKDKGRHHPTAVPTTSKTFVSWAVACVRDTCRPRCQSNKRPHTHCYLYGPPMVRVTSYRIPLTLPPMSDSNHVLRYAHPHQTPHRSTCRHGEGPPPPRRH